MENPERPVNFARKAKSQPIGDAYSTNAISGGPRVDRM